MITLIIGGSASGKSEYAETLLAKSTAKKKYYLATMASLDEESLKRILKHRKMREGKGFITLEQPVFLEKAKDGMEEGGSVLVECLSNLLANEMFMKMPPGDTGEIVNRIEKGIRILSDVATDTILVSNTVFEDGIIYDSATTEYLRALSLLNRRIAGFADRVWEVVAGIPISIK